MMQTNFQHVDEYISLFPENVSAMLSQIRHIIKESVPEAVEGISYRMPAYKLRGKPLCYFAGYEKHVGLYATPSAHAAFRDELSGYKQGKGSIQFPLDKALPIELISAIILLKAAELNSK